jgi:hypothetical protein
VELPPEILMFALFPTTLFETDNETAATIKILLDVDDGVIAALSPVTPVYVVLVVLNVSVFVVLTTCRTRNAPRRSFICAAVSTWPAVNVAGSVVGVAMQSA